jgi:uncharacterized protein Yka (UPF0111/DUF47 family)
VRDWRLLGEDMVRLIPREEKYYALLGNLVGKVRSGAALFVDLLADFEQRAGYAERIKAIEEECDQLVADIVAKLNTSFITPIDREDIYLLTTRSDDIIDEVNGLARRLEIVNVVRLRPDVPEIAGLLASALVEVEAAFGQLQKRNGVTEHGRRVRRLEKRGDVLYAEQLEDAIDRCKHLAESLESVVVKHT